MLFGFAGGHYLESGWMRRTVSVQSNSDKKASRRHLAFYCLEPWLQTEYLTMHPPLMYLGKPGVARCFMGP